MYRKISMLIVGCAALFVLSGCVSARTYVVNKPRVDQDVPGQTGAPVKTRKVMVLEVVEKNRMDAAGEARSAAGTGTVQTVSVQDDFALPQSAMPVKPAVEAPQPQDYVVQKDDTLQKIAKKTYGSYSKWTKIYDANREVIKDPNFLKPGITLKIPVVEEPAQTPAK